MYRLTILLLIPIAVIMVVLGYDMFSRIISIDLNFSTDVNFSIRQILIVACEVLGMILLGYAAYETVMQSLSDIIK